MVSACGVLQEAPIQSIAMAMGIGVISGSCWRCGIRALAGPAARSVATRSCGTASPAAAFGKPLAAALAYRAPRAGHSGSFPLSCGARGLHLRLHTATNTSCGAYTSDLKSS